MNLRGLLEAVAIPSLEPHRGNHTSAQENTETAFGGGPIARACRLRYLFRSNEATALPGPGKHGNLPAVVRLLWRIRHEILRRQEQKQSDPEKQHRCRLGI